MNTDKVRICIYPAAKQSGVGTYTDTLIKGLGDGVEYVLIENDIKVPRTSDPSVDHVHFQSVRLFLGYVRELLQKIRLFRNIKSNVEILHLNNMGAEVDSIAAKLSGIKRVVGTLHVMPGTSKDQSRIGYRTLEWLSLRCANELIAISNAVAFAWAKRVRLPVGRIKVVYNGVDYIKRDNGLNAPLYNRNNNEFVIVVTDRLHPSKCHSTIIKAFALIPPYIRAKMKLLFIGDGPEKRIISSLISEYGLDDSIIMTGYVENVFGYLAVADILISASRYEGMSYSVAEAMSCGMPCVVADSGGMAELIRASRGGCLFAVNDAKTLSECISKYYADRILKESDGMRAKDFANINLQAHSMCRKTADIYSGLIQRRIPYVGDAH